MFVSRVVVTLRIPSLEKKKVSRENYEPCLQLSHGQSLYYGQTGSRVAPFWSYYLQPELLVYVLLTLFPRLCQSVHNTRSCNQRNRPCKQHLGTAKQKACPLVSENACANKYIFENDADIFPNIHCLLRIACTIPVTSADNERANSTLKLVKGYLRTTMTTERLSGLGLMNIHHKKPVN